MLLHGHDLVWNLLTAHLFEAGLLRRNLSKHLFLKFQQHLLPTFILQLSCLQSFSMPFPFPACRDVFGASDSDELISLSISGAVLLVPAIVYMTDRLERLWPGP